MSNLSKYVGVPYKFLGEDETGVDCIGLIKWYYRDNGWSLVESDGKPIDKDWYSKDKYRLARYFLKHFDRTNDIEQLENGDILLFEINGEGHCGIMLSYGKFLTCYPQVSQFNGGVSFIDRTKYWFSQPGVNFIAGFKRRKQGDS
jgi:cell wall-associated NlpC family hydrolase